MRFWLAGLIGLVTAATAHATPACRLVGAPWLEGRVESGALARKVDARLGETIHVYLVAPGELRGKRVVFGDAGAGRVSFADAAAACGAATIRWRRVEPLMEHTKTKAPNDSATIYANAVVFGPRHGTWIGFDKLEYVESELPDVGGSIAVTDAKPSVSIGLPERAGDRAKLGVMRLAATIELAGATRTTTNAASARDGQIGDDVFRYTFRERGSDGFLAWLSTFYNVPYLFGSAGKGARSQAERYIGADCADVLVAALRRAGHPKMEYSSVAELVDQLRVVAGPVEEAACDNAGKCGVTSLRVGVDVAPGDLLAIDYIGYADLPRPWDHIVTFVEDSGPGGKADGVLGGDDFVADIGDKLGLKLEHLGQQGHVRVVVLRPPK